MHGDVLDPQARVFVDQLGQDLPHALLVAVPLRADRQAVHRHGEVQRLEVDVVVFGGVVQHGVEVDLVDLGHRDDVARHGAGHLDVLLALQHEQVPHLEGLAAVADVELAVLGDRALVDAEDAHAADVGVDRDLEDMRQHVLGGVGLGVHGLRRRALAVEEVGRVGLGRVGQQLDDEVQQLGHAGAGARRDEAHRDQVPLAQRLLQRRVQLAGVDVAVVQVAVDEVGVDLDHLLHQRAVRGVDQPKSLWPSRLKKQSTTLRAAGVGQVHRQAFAAEGGVDLRSSSAGQVDLGGVDPVDDDHAVEVARRRRTPSSAAPSARCRWRR